MDSLQMFTRELASYTAIYSDEEDVRAYLDDLIELDMDIFGEDEWQGDGA